MSLPRLILASLLYHWRTNLAVALGVAAGTAVLTGALLVGDSMRGSLRDLTLGRLGSVDEVLETNRFFREALADELAAQGEFRQQFAAAVPAIILRASLENTDPADPQRANHVDLVGCDQRFWRLWPDQGLDPSRRQVVLNRALADRLGVDKPGDDVMLHLSELGSIPGDSPLGKQHDTIRRVRLTVAAILPAEGPGRFSLRASQQVPLVAYVSMVGLQERLGQSQRVNALLVAGKSQGANGETGPTSLLEDHHRLLGRLLRPSPTDYGLRIEETVPGGSTANTPATRYINVTSDRMLVDPAVETAIRQILEQEQLRFQPVLTYLANAIAASPQDAARQEQDNDGKVIPYSTITAIDLAETPPLGPLRTPDGQPIGPLDDRAGDAIVLNSWAADDLGVEPDAKVYVSFFRPESTHGRAEEQIHEFRLAAVADLAGPADDPAYTPIVAGLTDKPSIEDWEVPFSPFYEGLIRSKDDVYYQQHGLTPKAFVSLAAGERLWGSRFGHVTGFRVAPEGPMTAGQLAEQLRDGFDPAALGFAFQPVKLQGLRASAGTTPFNLLFLGFSFFIIAAVVMLIVLMFRLGIDQRATELGILAAVGFGRRKIALLLAAEGLVVAALGSLVGAPAGIGYAAAMLLGLRTWWVAAVSTPFLRLHVGSPGQTVPWSLVVGLLSGTLVALAAIVWAVWRGRHTPVRQLLAGQSADAASLAPRRSRYAGKLAAAILVVAVVLGLAAAQLGAEAQAGAFFGAGTLVLAAALTVIRATLHRGSTGSAVAAGHGNLLRLALRNAARNPGRSTLTIGLVAAACFLIVAISAFRLDPSGQTPKRASGNGGFALVAQSDQPLHHDLGTVEGRVALGFSPQDLAQLAGTRTIALRVNAGDDASCLNLYRPRQPRVLGVPTQMIDRGGFVFTASAASTPEEHKNPWLLLDQDLGRDADGVPLVPVILEAATATYSLQLTGGVGATYEIRDGRDQPVRLKVVGLLGVSIFQGDLLIAESAFLRCFPDTDGYRFFLTETPPEKTEAVRRALERTLGDYGLAVEESNQRLAAFMAVQNTYLSTFQNLGGLGLLLGTFGLAAVQLRSVLERQGELALLRATGFRRRTLAEMVMLENGLLLLGGLGCGVLAAMVAVLPHLIFDRASIPWASLAGTLAVVLAAGLLAGLAAVRATLTTPLLPALRGD